MKISISMTVTLASLIAQVDEAIKLAHKYKDCRTGEQKSALDQQTQATRKKLIEMVQMFRDQTDINTDAVGHGTHAQREALILMERALDAYKRNDPNKKELLAEAHTVHAKAFNVSVSHGPLALSQYRRPASDWHPDHEMEEAKDAN